jgi:hypothetical protein
LLGKRYYSTLRQSPLVSGLLIGSLATAFTACHRPVAFFQRTPRDLFTYPARGRASLTDTLLPTTDNVPSPAADTTPVGYVSLRPYVSELRTNERVKERQQRVARLAQRPLLRPAAPASTRPAAVSAAVVPGPEPKKKKTFREWLGLPPRKKLNWWQRIPWQLKAATVVTAVAVVFAVLGITVLAIVFGIIGAYLLVRGLKKSFKVRRGIFNWRVRE